jgi:gas vesicle protein
MKESGIGSFLAGAMIGGLIGAAIGLLLAPATGEELREQVGEFVDGRKAAWDDAINEGRAAADRARAELVTEYDADADAMTGGAAPEGAF